MLRRVLRHLMPCVHGRTRCLHGDEILVYMTATGVIRRQVCLSCGRALRPLLRVCSVTGRPHR